MQLSIESKNDEIICAKVSGKITQGDVSPFHEPLGDQLGSACYGRRVLLDMSDVEMIDSSGISWLLVCHKRFRNANGQFILHSVSPVVHNVLKVLNMHSIFKIAENENKASEMVKGSAS